MKAFWLFARNAGDGSAGNPNRPAFPPGVGGKWTSPGDVIRLTGPEGSDHRHLLAGGIALPDDNEGDGHRHYVAKVGETWHQVTVGAEAHTHTLPTDAQGNLTPEFFLCFWFGGDAAAAEIAASEDCFPIVEATVTEDGQGGYTIGDLKDGWATHDTTWWSARMLNMLGVEMPALIDRGKRLVILFLGALLSRQTNNEPGYRFIAS